MRASRIAAADAYRPEQLSTQRVSGPLIRVGIY
jgi:hypothetical protein